ncbi:MAG TPA: TolC family protein, partial [Sphingomonas sp.]|nr:TolC family protein [Sphingomonas sp.]
MSRGAGLAALTALLLAGCAAVPKDSPQVERLQPTALGLDAGMPAIDAHWWTAFGDPQLDRLIAMGLSDNPTLEKALARVRAAEASVDVRRADQLPQITVDGQSTYQRFPEKYIYPPPYAGAAWPITQVQANLSWNLDLFGREKAMVAGARASAQAARLDMAAAKLTISTSIAQTYVGLARADRLIDVANGFVTTRQQALRYVQSRLEHQLASQFELRQAETLLAEAEQARTRAESQRDLLIHALAALAGRGADFYPQITAPTLALDAPPTVPDLLPADLLGRRPD